MGDWGMAIDPDNDCKIVDQGKALEISVPATHHDLNADNDKLNAPRVLREVSGDFTMTVKVIGTFQPGTQSTNPKAVPYIGAGSSSGRTRTTTSSSAARRSTATARSASSRPSRSASGAPAAPSTTGVSRPAASTSGWSGVATGSSATPARIARTSRGSTRWSRATPPP
jgi:hypothetical protein